MWDFIATVLDQAECKEKDTGMLTKSLIALSLAFTLGSVPDAGAAPHHFKSVRPSGSQGYASTQISEPEYMRIRHAAK
jgi:hypothetical protein